MIAKEPLFRKVNTTAHGVDHYFGGDFCDQRNTKTLRRSEAQRRPMHGKVKRGLDYTPLFRFLLSRVGRNWDEVYAEAVKRLDRPEPIFWMVATRESEREDYICIGRTSYFSGLYVDEAGLLQIVNPEFGPATLVPLCKCCTYTFNGVRFSRPYPGYRAYA